MSRPIRSHGRPSARELYVHLERGSADLWWFEAGGGAQRLGASITVQGGTVQGGPETPDDAVEGSPTAVQDPARVAAIVAELLACAGHGTDIVLVLGESCFETLQVFLGELPEDEVPGVLARRAANTLDCPLSEVAHWSLRLVPPVEVDTRSGSEATWIVHAQERSAHRDLLVHLRDAGVRVRRVVALRDALPRLTSAPASAAGSIQLVVCGGVVFAHLMRGEEVVQESRLDLLRGNETGHDVVLEMNPFVIVQEVRQLAAFWAKSSRTSLAGVSLFGFTEQEFEELSTSLGIAAKGAPVVDCSPARGEELGARRQAVFGALRGMRRAPTDLNLNLPLRKGRVVLALTLVAAMMILVARFTHSKWGDLLDRRSAQVEGWRDLSKDLDLARLRMSGFEDSTRDLETSIASIEALERHGIPIERALADLWQVLGPEVRVRHVGFVEDAQGVRIAVEGRVPAQLEAAVEALTRLVERGRAHESLREVAVEPSSRVPESGHSIELVFTLSALYAGGES